MVVLGLYIAGGLVSRKIIGRFKRALILGCVIGVVNAFWLIPQVYFVAQHTNVVMHLSLIHICTEMRRLVLTTTNLHPCFSVPKFLY